jgi:hypothetical protein
MKFTVTYAYFPSHNHVSVMSLTLTIGTESSTAHCARISLASHKLLDIVHLLALALKKLEQERTRALDVCKQCKFEIYMGNPLWGITEHLQHICA